LIALAASWQSLPVAPPRDPRGTQRTFNQYSADVGKTGLGLL